MQRHPLHTQHGFSLIEMLIALVVLSIALLGMSRASVSMITVHTANERLARASALLQDRMETLKHSGYSGVATVNVEAILPTRGYGLWLAAVALIVLSRAAYDIGRERRL